METKTKAEKMKNVPNMLSMFRFLCTPIMMILFLVEIPNGIGVFAALAIYIIGSLTDMADGHIARKYNLVSDFGKFIDQIADKFLQTSALILVLMSNVIEPTWVAILILSIIVLRDITTSGIRQIAASKGVVVAADMLGKVKSVIIDIATMILMLYLGLLNYFTIGDAAKFLLIPVNYIGVFGYGLLIVGAALSLISGINYTINAWPLIVGSLKNTNVKPKEEEKFYTASGRVSVVKTKTQELFNNDKKQSLTDTQQKAKTSTQQKAKTGTQQKPKTSTQEKTKKEK